MIVPVSTEALCVILMVYLLFVCCVLKSNIVWVYFTVMLYRFGYIYVHMSIVSAIGVEFSYKYVCSVPVFISNNTVS